MTRGVPFLEGSCALKDNVCADARPISHGERTRGREAPIGKNVPAPLDTLATRYVGSWLAVLVDSAVLFDALVVMSAFMATTSRGMFVAILTLKPRPSRRDEAIIPVEANEGCHPDPEAAADAPHQRHPFGRLPRRFHPDTAHATIATQA